MKNLKKLRIPLIKIAFKLIEKNLINRINFQPLQDALKTNQALMIDVTDKLTDKDPNNAAQLQEVWQKHKESTRKTTLIQVKAAITELVKDQDAAKDLIVMLELLSEEENDSLPTALALPAQPNRR